MKTLPLNTIFIQACSGDEDGMLGFDLHSDGQGQRWETQTHETHVFGLRLNILFGKLPFGSVSDTYTQSPRMTKPR